jgi:iron only hydrogenase large subunit-like protein
VQGKRGIAVEKEEVKEETDNNYQQNKGKHQKKTDMTDNSHSKKIKQEKVENDLPIKDMVGTYR